jgi:putative endonuclease
VGRAPRNDGEGVVNGLRKVPRVYIRANRKNGTLYVGVSANLSRRSYLHDIKFEPDSFVARHRLERLVYIETHERMIDAIAREKQLKAGSRADKIKLIERDNPEWEDLAPLLVDID